MTPTKLPPPSGKLAEIWLHLDELMHILRPRFCNDVVMGGRYPCWIVWLPKYGTTERMSLADALVECYEQWLDAHDKVPAQ